MRMQVKGDTLDTAINNAMVELATTSDNIAYDIVQEGTQGFLGIGAKPFIIEAYKKDDKEEIYKNESKDKKDKLVQNEQGVYEFKVEKGTERYNKNRVEFDAKVYDEAYNAAKRFLEPIFKEFGITIDVTYTTIPEANTIVLNIKGDKIGVVIGKHGQTLDALQHLVNIIINNGKKERVHIRIDSENYREKRNKTLESLAKSVANNVRKTHKDYELEPMSSYERRIIHYVLQKERNIETTSIGFDKERHVVVKYKR